MSCVEVKTERKNGIYLLSSRKDGINVKAEGVNLVYASIDRLGGVDMQTKRKGGVSLSIGLICEIDVGKYMRVTPKETQWINVDMSIDYNVFSNVEWELV